VLGGAGSTEEVVGDGASVDEEEMLLGAGSAVGSGGGVVVVITSEGVLMGVLKVDVGISWVEVRRRASKVEVDAIEEIGAAKTGVLLASSIDEDVKDTGMRSSLVVEARDEEPSVTQTVSKTSVV
jgi:hypothetical protein